MMGANSKTPQKKRDSNQSVVGSEGKKNKNKSLLAEGTPGKKSLNGQVSTPKQFLGKQTPQSLKQFGQKGGKKNGPAPPKDDSEDELKISTPAKKQKFQDDSQGFRPRESFDFKMFVSNIPKQVTVEDIKKRFNGVCGVKDVIQLGGPNNPSPFYSVLLAVNSEEDQKARGYPLFTVKVVAGEVGVVDLEGVEEEEVLVEEVLAEAVEEVTAGVVLGEGVEVTEEEVVVAALVEEGEGLVGGEVGVGSEVEGEGVIKSNLIYIKKVYSPGTAFWNVHAGTLEVYKEELFPYCVVVVRLSGWGLWKKLREEYALVSFRHHSGALTKCRHD
uniref:RRM domain-containing protein n=1 Tax=Timema monikensis TaxID=170555 RepID=A0A7R9E1J9_9NEOP|nr:unnamed protein product [Timema monikensis]